MQSYNLLAIEQAKEKFDCPVCMELYQSPQKLTGCGHTVCLPCIQKLPKLCCPSCTAEFGENDYHPNQDMLDEIKVT